jgi:uncharacterized protein YndB with AHSA1/START domain
MPRVAATRELQASREDVWRFLAEPRLLADWWPGTGAVEPDRRGLAVGARWTLRGDSGPTLLHRPYAESLLLVREVLPYEKLRWYTTRDRLEAEISIHATSDTTTEATLVVSSEWYVPFRRSLPRTALSRLSELCQTAAAF